MQALEFDWPASFGRAVAVGTGLKAAKACPKLIHDNRLPKGGHFAAWEHPELFEVGLRAAFKSLR